MEETKGTNQETDPLRPLLCSELCALLDVLRDDADGNLGNAAGADGNTHGAGNLFQLLGCSDFFRDEMLEDGAGLAGAADHPEETKGLLNPIAQDERIMPVTAGDDESAGRTVGQWFGEELLPDFGVQLHFGGEIARAGQGRAIVKDGDVEI